MPREIDLGPFKVGASHPHFVIAGPCVIESERIVLETAQRIAEIRGSPEGREGIAAFLEKRKASWCSPKS